MGLYIYIEADSLIEIPKDGIKKFLSRLILLPLLPFVPSLLILNVTSIQNEKEKLMIEWKSKCNVSPSNIALRLDSIEEKAKKSRSAYVLINMSLFIFNMSNIRTRKKIRTYHWKVKHLCNWVMPKVSTLSRTARTLVALSTLALFLWRPSENWVHWQWWGAKDQVQV